MSSKRPRNIFEKVFKSKNRGIINRISNNNKNTVDYNERNYESKKVYLYDL